MTHPTADGLRPQINQNTLRGVASMLLPLRRRINSDQSSPGLKKLLKLRSTSKLSKAVIKAQYSAKIRPRNFQRSVLRVKNAMRVRSP